MVTATGMLLRPRNRPWQRKHCFLLQTKKSNSSPLYQSPMFYRLIHPSALTSSLPRLCDSITTGAYTRGVMSSGAGKKWRGINEIQWVVGVVAEVKYSQLWGNDQFPTLNSAWPQMERGWRWWYVLSKLARRASSTHTLAILSQSTCFTLKYLGWERTSRVS